MKYRFAVLRKQNNLIQTHQAAEYASLLYRCCFADTQCPKHNWNKNNDNVISITSLIASLLCTHDTQWHQRLHNTLLCRCSMIITNNSLANSTEWISKLYRSCATSFRQGRFVCRGCSASWAISEENTTAKNAATVSVRNHCDATKMSLWKYWGSGLIANDFNWLLLDWLRLWHVHIILFG